MTNDYFEILLKPLCNWVGNKIRENGIAMDSKYQWQIKKNQHPGYYKGRFLLNTYQEHSKGVQGRMMPGTGKPGYEPFQYYGFSKGVGILEGVVPLPCKPSSCCDILASIIEATPSVYPLVAKCVRVYKETKNNSNITPIEYSCINNSVSKKSNSEVKIPNSCNLIHLSNTDNCNLSLPLLRNIIEHNSTSPYVNKNEYLENNSKAA